MFIPPFAGTLVILATGCLIFLEMRFIMEQTQKIVDYFTKLMTFVETAEPLSFKFIRTYFDYQTYQEDYRNTTALVRSLKKVCKGIIKDYCRQLSIDEGQFNKLLFYHSLLKVITFYQADLKVLSGMLQEYRMYLLSGNFLDFVFPLKPRPDSKLRDYRRFLWNIR